MTFGENLKKIRKQKNLTQADLANIMNCSKMLISSYETGKRNPKVRTLLTFARALECSIDDLLPDDSYILKAGKRVSIENKEMLQYTSEVLKESFSKINKTPLSSLTYDEIKLLSNYKLLNDIGKQKVSDYTKDLVNNPNYKNDPE